MSVSSNSSSSSSFISNVIPTCLHQLFIISKKNVILQTRYWRSTLIQVFLAPIFMLFLLWILQLMANNKSSKIKLHPDSFPLRGLSRCVSGPGMYSDSCITLMVTPNDAKTRTIMSLFSAKNQLKTGIQLNIEDSPLTSISPPISTSKDIVFVQDSDFIYNYVNANRNSTKFGISFSYPDNSNISYQVWHNETLTKNGTDLFGDEIVGLVRGIDEALWDYFGDPSGNTLSSRFRVTVKPWPFVPQTLTGNTIVTTLGAAFFFASTMVIFINVLSTVAGERELKLRQSMEQMGLKSWVYFMGKFLIFSGIVFFASLVTCLFGLAFGFFVFTGTNFMVRSPYFPSFLITGNLLTDRLFGFFFSFSVLEWFQWLSS